MDHLKEGIGLRGYGQHDPLVEYKRESFDMFEEMMQRFQEETVRYLYLMQIMERPPEPAMRPNVAVQTSWPAKLPMPAYPQSSLAVAAATGGRGRSRPRWMKSKKPFSGRKRKNWNSAHGRAGDQQVQQIVRREKKSAQRSVPLRKR